MDWLTQARWRFGRIGAGACVMLAVWVALNMALSMMLVQAMGQNAVNAPIWLQFLISSGPLYLIAMPMGLMLMKAVPELPTRRFPMTPGRFFTLLLMCHRQPAVDGSLRRHGPERDRESGHGQ